MRRGYNIATALIFAMMLSVGTQAHAGSIFPKAATFFKSALPAAASSAIGRMKGLGAMPIPSGQGSSPMSLIQSLGKMNGMMSSPSFMKFFSSALPMLNNFSNIQNMIMGKMGINPSAILGGMGINMGSLLGGIVQNDTNGSCVMASSSTAPTEASSNGHLLANPIVSTVLATPIAAGGDGIFPNESDLKKNGEYNPEGDDDLLYDDKSSGPQGEMDKSKLP